MDVIWNDSAKVGPPRRVSTTTSSRRAVRRKASSSSRKIPERCRKKLNEIEPKIIERISRGNYVCTYISLDKSCFTYLIQSNAHPSSSKNNSEVFWRRHCNAVPALIGKIEPNSNGNDSTLTESQAGGPSQPKQVSG